MEIYNKVDLIELIIKKFLSSFKRVSKKIGKKSSKGVQ